MLIDISRLKRNPGMVQDFCLEEALEPVIFNKERLEFSGPVRVEVTATNSGGNIILKGDVRASVVLHCSRCLERYNRDAETGFEREYSIVPAAEKNDDIEPVRGDTIDLTGPVVESIMLELPMKQVCREECKGLCNVCGTNLNYDTCSCEKEDIDPRFEVLKKFFKS